MTEQFDMSSVNYPYGILHDQKLSKVTLDESKMVFTFDIVIYPNNYYDETFRKYENFKHCDMVVEIQDEPYNDIKFVTNVNGKGKFSGLSVNESEFIDIINNASSAEFVGCSATCCGEFRIQLAIGFYNAKGKYKKYNKYDMCYITLDATTVKWNWY